MSARFTAHGKREHVLNVDLLRGVIKNVGVLLT